MPTVDAITARIALNESLFKEVNRNILKTSAEGRYEEAHFICECGERSCEAKIALPVEVYREIRQNKRQFFVKPGHEMPKAERVIERHESYSLIEKPAEVDPLLDD